MNSLFKAIRRMPLIRRKVPEKQTEIREVRPSRCQKSENGRKSDSPWTNPRGQELSPWFSFRTAMDHQPLIVD